MTRRRLIAALLLGAVPIAGGLTACGGSSSDSAGAQKVRTVEKTRVRVVEQQRGSGGTRFDAEGLYRHYSPGVVTVISIFDGASSLLNGGGQGGQGSGFVLDGDGYIATNAHVVTNGEGARAKRAKSVYIEFSDGNRVPGKVVGADLNSDVALLKVDPAGLSLTPLSLGVSHGLKVGDPVAAIGSPFGEQQSLSVGVISALNRNIDSLTSFRSATPSRPTPPSTPATRAARCSTRAARCSASTPRSSRPAAAARAWASRCRRTACAARCARSGAPAA